MVRGEEYGLDSERSAHDGEWVRGNSKSWVAHVSSIPKGGAARSTGLSLLCMGQAPIDKGGSGSDS